MFLLWQVDPLNPTEQGAQLDGIWLIWHRRDDFLACICDSTISLVNKWRAEHEVSPWSEQHKTCAMCISSQQNVIKQWEQKIQTEHKCNTHDAEKKLSWQCWETLMLCHLTLNHFLVAVDFQNTKMGGMTSRWQKQAMTGKNEHGVKRHFEQSSPRINQSIWDHRLSFRKEV